MISNELLSAIRSQYRLSWQGTQDRADRGVIPGFALELWGVEKPGLEPRKL